MFAKDYSTEESYEILLTKFKNKMFGEVLHFRNELKRWYKMQELEITKRDKNWQDTAAARAKKEVVSVIKKDNRKRNVEPAKRVDGKQQYQIDPPDGLLETTRLADYDLFPNLKKLLVIVCIPQVQSTEADRAASGVRRLKTPFRSAMGEQLKSDSNLPQLQ